MDKKSFVMYMSWMPMLKAMPDEQLGKLMKAVACYQTGEEYDPDDPMVAAIWEMFRATFDEDAAKYEEKCEQNKQIALQAAENRKRTQANGSERQRTLANAEKKERTPADSDSDSDTDNDSLKDIKPYSPAEPYSEEIEQIVEHLNEKLGSHYKDTTPKTRQLIRSRMKEGFKVPDFIMVIDKKVKEWTGTEQEKFLRPETLFGTKFEGYLNQKARAAPQKKNSFTTMEEHEYDMEALEAQLLRQTAEGRAG